MGDDLPKINFPIYSVLVQVWHSQNMKKNVVAWAMTICGFVGG
jgi:hypothetical protein